MFGRLSAFVLITLLSLPTLAARDVMLFVFATENSPHITPFDYSGSAHALKEFEKLVQRTNNHIAPENRPLVLRVEVKSLKELAAKTDEALAASQEPQGKIKMLFFSGHGNGQRFYLHDKAGYTGAAVAKILAVPEMHGKLAPDLGVYVGACSCGESLSPSNFQVEMMSEFKKINESYGEGQQTRSLVSLAHRFSSVDASFKMRSFYLDTILYKMKVLKVVHDFDIFIFKYVGRYAAGFSSILLGGALYGAANLLHTHVSPEAVGPALDAVLTELPKAAVAMGVIHTVIKTWAFKWSQKIGYEAGSAVSEMRDISSGHGVLEMIRVNAPVCGNLF